MPMVANNKIDNRLTALRKAKFINNLVWCRHVDKADKTCRIYTTHNESSLADLLKEKSSISDPN